MRGIIEEVRDLDEFKEVVNEEYKIHYETFWSPIQDKDTGFPYRVEAGIVFYGIHKKGHIVKCVLVDAISWNDKKLKEYNGQTVYENYNEWIKETLSKFETIAKELNATKGRYYWQEE